MTEKSASQAALEAFTASLKYYQEGLRRCTPNTESCWRDKINAATRVVHALHAYEDTLAYWRSMTHPET